MKPLEKTTEECCTHPENFVPICRNNKNQNKILLTTKKHTKRKLQSMSETLLVAKNPQTRPTTRQIASAVNILKTVQLNDNESFACLDIKSLYSSIPVDEALGKIEPTVNFPQHVIELSKQCPKKTYSSNNGKIYKQTEDAPMGSLSPLMANHYMIYFEEETLEIVQIIPTVWKRYVNDIFISFTFTENHIFMISEHI